MHLRHPLVLPNVKYEAERSESRPPFRNTTYEAERPGPDLRSKKYFMVHTTPRMLCQIGNYVRWTPLFYLR